jgi:multidrug resistance efflux pump
MSAIIKFASDTAKTYTIPLLAIAGMGMAAFTVVKSSRPTIPTPPVSEPPKTPFGSSVAGSGIVEPNSQNIAVGTPVAGIVQSVAVRAGDDVKAGDTLFTIDSREIQAELAARQAALAARQAALRVAAARLEALRAYPRPESIPPAEAKVAEIAALLSDAEAQLAKWENVADPRAVSEDTVNQKRFAVQTQKARLTAAQADLALVKAGTFKPEIDSAQASVDEAASTVATAQADLDAIRVELDRRTVKASVTGKVLQVNIRPGEFAQAGAVQTPHLILGSLSPLHVRVDVDENEAWRVGEGRNAVAFLRGNSDFKASLKFVRFEPYIVPKKSLTGESTERVDTRVLQIIFAVDQADFPMFVGQQVDAYIEAAPRRASKGEQPFPAASPAK